jgi:hypothetical protein
MGPGSDPIRRVFLAWTVVITTGRNLKSRTSESRSEPDPNGARRARRDVIVAIGIQVVSAIQNILEVGLQLPPLREWHEHTRIDSGVAGNVTVLSIAANISE